MKIVDKVDGGLNIGSVYCLFSTGDVNKAGSKLKSISGFHTDKKWMQFPKDVSRRRTRRRQAYSKKLITNTLCTGTKEGSLVGQEPCVIMRVRI